MEEHEQAGGSPVEWHQDIEATDFRSLTAWSNRARRPQGEQQQPGLRCPQGYFDAVVQNFRIPRADAMQSLTDRKVHTCHHECQTNVWHAHL